MDVLRRDAARNRDQILRAARRLAAQGQPLALNAVARAAEVGVGTVYRHFATVEELEETLVWAQFDALADTLADTTPEHLERALTAHFTLLADDPVFERVTSKATPALEHTRRTREALVAQLAGLLDGARTRGEVRAEVDAPALLLLVCGLAHAVRSAQVPSDGPTAQALLRIVLDGLRAR